MANMASYVIDDHASIQPIAPSDGTISVLAPTIGTPNNVGTNHAKQSPPVLHIDPLSPLLFYFLP